MVGRELPNLRPNGEDHRGAGGGKQTGMLRTTVFGAMTPESKSWRRRVKTRIHKASGWLCGVTRGSSAILFILRV